MFSVIPSPCAYPRQCSEKKSGLGAKAGPKHNFFHYPGGCIARRHHIPKDLIETRTCLELTAPHKITGLDHPATGSDGTQPIFTGENRPQNRLRMSLKRHRIYHGENWVGDYSAPTRPNHPPPDRPDTQQQKPPLRGRALCRWAGRPAREGERMPSLRTATR